MKKIDEITTGAPKNQSAWYVDAVEKLLDVIQNLSHARDMSSVAIIVRTAARRLVGADGASFVLRDNDKCYYVDEDAIAPLWKGQRFPMSMCVSGWVMNNARPAIIDDIYKDPRVPTDAYRPTFVKSMAMVPIRQVDSIGAIGTYWAKVRQPRDEEVRILQALANATSIAMENIDLNNRLQQSLQQRERAVFDNVREGIVTFDEDGIISGYNHACEVIFGYSKDDAIGRNITDIVPVIHIRAISGHHTEAAETIKRKNGDDFFSEISIAEFTLNEKCCFSAIIRDISERKLTEKVLQDSELRYELALNGSNDGLWDWNIPSNDLYWSDRFREMLRIKDTDFKPSYAEFKARIHPDDHDRITKQLEEHTKTSQPYDAEFRMRTEDDDYIWVRARGACIRGSTGRALRMSGSLSDISASKKIQNELDQARLRAEQASQAKTEFINNVSRELGPSLDVIMNAVKLLADDKTIDAVHRAQVGRVYHTAGGLLRVVDGMLGMSASEDKRLRK